MSHVFARRWAIVASVFVSLLTGCTAIPRAPAITVEQSSRAEVAGLQGIRHFSTTQAGIDAVVGEIDRQHKAVPLKSNFSTIDFLSISGGGDNGAFAAGLLNGWTVRGDRPTFQLVTGVSTGALIAPFAFLGAQYDGLLRDLYTSITPEAVFKPVGLSGALWGEAYADTSPLYRLISKHINEELLRRIAYEYNQNHRWLVVATTNLDAGLPMIWNMGKIASQGTPEALKLFRNILLASASIPGAFPPVMFDVSVDGKAYQEMHVDGGVSSQAFLYPPMLQEQLQQDPKYAKVPRRVYIIRNSRLVPEGDETQRRTVDIVGRAIGQLISNQGVGDLYRMYVVTQADGLAYNLAYIGTDFDFPHRYEFDPDYVKALYQYGYEQALSGNPWHTAPPGIDKPLM